MTTRNLLIACLLASVCTAGSRVREAVNDNQRVALRGHVHALATLANDQGAVEPGSPMEHMLLLLKRSPEQQEALDLLLEQQQDADSPNYQRWLSAEEFGKRFGAEDSDIQALTSWLLSHGFDVKPVSVSKSSIEFSGTAAQLEEAFHVHMHRYAVNGRMHMANNNDPEIPAALAPVVDGFASLNNFALQSHSHIDPKVTYTDGDHALAPADFASIYNLNPLYGKGINGRGVNIAVIGRTDVNLQDIADFRKKFDLPSNLPRKVLVPGSGDPGTTDDLDEAILDLTWSGAVAPNATIQYVYAASTWTTDGIMTAARYAVDQNLAEIASVSYGSCETTAANASFFYSLTQQAAAQGMTFVVSTGDEGSAGCDNANRQKTATHGLAVNYLASSPFVVAVGGTQFNEGSDAGRFWNADSGSGYGSAKGYIPERVWNESCAAGESGCTNPNIWAGSGGASKLYKKPSWQAGVNGIPNDGHRDLPDVSLAASGTHDPYLICIKGDCSKSDWGVSEIGGTSAAAPAFAGILALASQSIGGRLGVANTVLYSLAARQPGVFHDITVGNNAVPGEAGYGTSDATYPARTGYDLATGLGSVDADQLVSNWKTPSAKYSPTSTTLKLGTNDIPEGGSASFTVTVSALTGTATPTGKVSISAHGSALAAVDLSSGYATGNLSDLPAGVYEITATYNGDGRFAPSTSSTATLTVRATQSQKPAITSVTPGVVRAGANVTLVVSGSGFAKGLAAYIWVDGTYYPMGSTVTGNQVRVPVTMSGPGPYDAAVVVVNPNGLSDFAWFTVTN